MCLSSTVIFFKLVEVNFRLLICFLRFTELTKKSKVLKVLFDSVFSYSTGIGIQVELMIS